jgi:hypothetical protein
MAVGVLGVLLLVTLVAVAWGDRVDSGTGPLALYPGERSGDDADLNGVLIREGDCLYVEEGGTRFLLAFPRGETSWRESDESVRLGGRILRIGEVIAIHFDAETMRVGDHVDFGGGGGSANREWAAPPDPSCDITNIWNVG